MRVVRLRLGSGIFCSLDHVAIIVFVQNSGILLKKNFALSKWPHFKSTSFIAGVSAAAVVKGILIHVAFFYRKKARKILPLRFLHKSFINNVKRKMQFRKNSQILRKINIFLICVLASGKNTAVFGKILVTSYSQKPFDNTFLLFFFAIKYAVSHDMRAIEM